MSEKNPIRTARTLIQDLPADSNELSDLSPQELEAIAGGAAVATLAVSQGFALAYPCTCTANCDTDCC